MVSKNKNIFDTSTYRTPDTEEQPVLSLVHECLEGIELDPTSEGYWTGAQHHYKIWQNSLQLKWKTRSVFMNPPFNEGVKFLNKLQTEYDKYQFEAIALVLSGQLHNKGNQNLNPKAICHWRGRMGFVINMDGQDVQVKGMSYDVIFMYWGSRFGRFYNTFNCYGKITKLLGYDYD